MTYLPLLYRKKFLRRGQFFFAKPLEKNFGIYYNVKDAEKYSLRREF